MFAKSDIRKITLAFEKALYHEVYFALGKAGIIHLSRFHEREAVTDAGLQAEESLIREVLSGTEYALNAMLLPPEQAEGSVQMADKTSDAASVEGIKKTIERALRLRVRIRQALDKVAEQIEYVAALSTMGIDPGMLKRARLVVMVFGTVENELWDPPPGDRFMILKTGRYLFGIALPADLPAMLQFLKGHGFADKTDVLRMVPHENLKDRADTLKRRSDLIDGYINRLKEEKGQELKQLNSAYRVYEQMLKAMRMSVFSSRTMFVTGWMEKRDEDRLTRIMKGICGDRFIVSEQKDPDAPVRLMNMRLFKPFELLVKLMGMPSNSEVDPTPLAALTYVLMFGLMFGDLGQGLVLMLAGILLKWFAKRKVREELAQAGEILIACGLSAAVCGLLYGSFFSSEHMLPALWFHPSADIMRLFSITIMMGVAFIVVGICVNIINCLIHANYTEALLEKRGLAVLILYVALVFFVLKYQRTGQFAATWQISVFVIVPLIIFSMKGVLGPVLFKGAKPHSIVEYVIETIMEIMEIGLSLFANTLSFIRVGAFALSHAGLSIVTYTLAGMADPTMKSAGSFIIIVIGNIFIIGFEGLICGIQSMRLEYYEFFSKFFKGDGVVFSPFTLKAKVLEV